MELVEARRPVEIAMQIRGVAIATPGVQNVRGRSSGPFEVFDENGQLLVRINLKDGVQID